AAGEKVEAGAALERLAEPVEQRFAHAIGCRAKIGPVGNCNAPAAEFTGDDAHSAFVRIHASMVALSWAARLKAGLARTRDVLNTPVSELFTRRTVDEALYEELETALLQADCGVEATQVLMASLRKKKAEDGEALKQALKDALIELLSPLERKFEVKGA